MKYIKEYNKFINESTGHFLPSYSDDGTADRLSNIHKKTSKVLNDELRKVEKDIIKLDKSITYIEPEKQQFYNKWMYGNMIFTSIQDGYFLDIDLVKRAKELYIELLNDPKINEYTKENKNPETFKKDLNLVLRRYDEDKFDDAKDYIYRPGFMREDKDKKREHIIS
jgi:hypothetical protein